MGKLLNKIICGNSVSVLKKLPSDFVDCVITSPPYWALRDYGSEVETIWDAKEGCEHEFGIKERKNPMDRGGKGQHDSGGIVGKMGDKVQTVVKSGFCSKCGAWKGQLGLEPSFDLYIKHLCDIFDEVKRVLRKDGTCWVNIGDTYGGSGNRKGHTLETSNLNRLTIGYGATEGNQQATKGMEKSLCLNPFRFAIEMVNRGWLLRNTIIWHKPNCMPSSVKDRFTVDFEYVFFFVKNKKYWFETQYENSLYKTEIPIEKSDRRQSLINKLYQIKKDIRDEKIAYSGKSKAFSQYNNALANAKAYRTGLEILQEQEHLTKEELSFLRDYTQNHFSRPQGRNKRCVWTITTKPFKEAHFAVFPETLVEPMIKAGCPEFVCKKCGKARKKIFNTTTTYLPYKHPAGKQPGKIFSVNAPRWESKTNFIGYTKCGCNAGFDGGIVLDPFCGSGTTLLMAKKLGRNYIGIDANADYVKMGEKRINNYSLVYKVKK